MAVAGALLIYAGYKGVNPVDAFKGIMSGQTASTTPTTPAKK